jgi:hypothetical protein
MPIEVTGDPSTFPASITTPTNGDPVNGPGWLTAMQDVADQIAYLKDRTVFAQYTKAGVASNPDLVESLNLSGFTLQESNQAIKVPAVGYYLVSLAGGISPTATGESNLSLNIVTGTGGGGYTTRVTLRSNANVASAATMVGVSGSVIVNITNVTTQLISLTAGAALDNWDLVISVRRVG